MDEKIFLDSFNIKTYPELIINHLKENKIKTNLTNLRSFYSELLNSINDNVKDSYLNRILKYMSSNTESTILILDDIKDNIYKNELLSFFNGINNLICEKNTYSYFYKNLLEQCSFIFFSEEEISYLNELFDAQKYDELLYTLFVHACADYKINTPKIVGERLLNDAFCLFSATKLRNVLLRASADLGNEIACTLYGTLIYPDYNKRLYYFLKGKSHPINLWNIGFIIEHYELTKEQFESIKKELKNILEIGSKYVNNTIVIDTSDPFQKDCTIEALKIYYYLANEKNYSKALCSVGKFFLTKKTAICENNKIDEKASIQEGIEYSTRAIKLGNIHAMQNVGTYFYQTGEKTNIRYKELLQIGANAKDVLSSLYMSQILIDENRVEEAEDYLKLMSEGNSSEALYQLGKIYETRMQIDEAIKYYEKAINNKYYIASYNLAKIYFNQYMNEDSSSNKKNAYLIMAINLIESYYDKYDDYIKNEAKFLLSNMKNMVKIEQKTDTSN